VNINEALKVDIVEYADEIAKSSDAVAEGSDESSESV